MDDRIGVVLEGEEPIAPGASVCNTDVGAPASYVVQESDAGSVIHNNAVITAQTQEAELAPVPADGDGRGTRSAPFPRSHLPAS